MKDQFHTVCMTVTHDVSHDRLPILLDECLDLVGTSPEFLYGIQGRTARDAFGIADLRLGTKRPQTFATLTLRIPNDVEAPLQGDGSPGIRVLDCKRLKKITRTALLKAFCSILGRHHDSETISSVIGNDASRDNGFHRLTMAYPEHLPELMRSLRLDLGIFMMRTNGGRISSIAMIDRRLVQTYVTAIESDREGQAFSYRLADRDGQLRDIVLPRRIRHSIAYASTKRRYQSRIATVQMTISTNVSEPGDVLEVDVMCGSGVGPGHAWAIGVLDHREAHNALTHSTIAQANVNHPFRRGVATKTLLTLTNPEETWPDCSRHDALLQTCFFDPNNASTATLNAFIALLEVVIDRYAYRDRIRPAHKDPRKLLEALVLEYPQHAFDALEQTHIDVAVLPTRWPDSTVSLIVAVKTHCIQKYLRSAVTIGVAGPVRYVTDYDNEDGSPTWIEINRPALHRFPCTASARGRLPRAGDAPEPHLGLAS